MKKEDNRIQVRIVPMEGKKDRFKVVTLEGQTVIDGNHCGFKSRVNAVRALNKSDYKIIYDEATKEDCAEYYARKSYMRNMCPYDYDEE